MRNKDKEGERRKKKGKEGKRKGKKEKEGEIPRTVPTLPFLKKMTKTIISESNEFC